jgi:hypothetical protein
MTRVSVAPLPTTRQMSPNNRAVLRSVAAECHHAAARQRTSSSTVMMASIGAPAVRLS